MTIKICGDDKGDKERRQEFDTTGRRELKRARAASKAEATA